MGDRVFTEGFPDNWAMVEREDCTILSYRGQLTPFGAWTAFCLAPKMRQGEAWLETARQIAWSVAADRKADLDKRFDEFCDECGIGPPHDEASEAVVNSRSMKSWRCDHCNCVNSRPKQKEKISVGKAAAIAVDQAIAKVNGPRPKLSTKMEALLIKAVETAIENERLSHT